MSSTATDAQVYKAVLEAEAAGRPVLPADLDTAKAYAKRTKKRAPKAEVAVAKPKVKTAKPADAPREPKGIAKPATSKTAKAPRQVGPKVCTAKGCEKTAIAKGLCSADYARLRRQDPAEREKANEASKAYYARQRAAALKAAGVKA